jgi:hypothetical protein
MYRRIINKFKELPPKFFLIAGIAWVVVLIAVPILLHYINGRIDESPDYKMVLDQYSTCDSCKTFTGEKPKFERVSYSSEGYSPRKYSYVINVTGVRENAIIKAELRKIGESYEIIKWMYSNSDTSIVID